MKNIIFKKFLLYFFTFILLILVFNLSLYCACSFPSDLIKKNVKESADVLLNEGNFYSILNLENARNDNYTDSLVINESYSIDNNDIIYSYMSGRKNYRKNLTKVSLPDVTGNLLSFSNNNYNDLGKPIADEEYDTVKELHEFVNGNVTTSVNYSRYWHGYLVIFRPLLLLFNILELRILLAIIFIALFIWLISLINKKINTSVAIIFSYSLIGFGYFFESYSLQGAPLFIIMMISSIVLLLNIEKYDKNKFYYHIFITACVANFVDYLTVPLLTLGIPLYIYILYNKYYLRATYSKQDLKFIVFSSIIWLLGYGMTWVSKWILFDLLYNGNGIISAISQIKYRSYGENTDFYYYLLLAVIFFVTITLTLFLAYFTLLLIIKKDIKFSKDYKNIIKNNLHIVLISIMPIAWSTILLNHSIYHTVFTHRNFILLLIGLLVCINDCQYVENTRSKHNIDFPADL